MLIVVFAVSTYHLIKGNVKLNEENCSCWNGTVIQCSICPLFDIKFSEINKQLIARRQVWNHFDLKISELKVTESKIWNHFHINRIKFERMEILHCKN